MAKTKSKKTETKKFKITNIIMMLLLILSIDFSILSYNTGVIHEAGVLVILNNYTDKELQKKYKDNDYYNKSIENYNKTIKEYEEKLEKNPDDKQTQLEMQRYSELKQFIGITQAEIRNSLNKAKIEILIIDIVLILTFILISKVLRRK